MNPITGHGRPGAWILRALAGLALAMLVAACGDEKRVWPTEEFSMNVWQVPEWWPREEEDFPPDPEEKQVQQDELDKRGKPDFIHFVWTRDGHVIRQIDLKEKVRRAGALEKPRQEWVYLEEQKIIAFKGKRVIERPIDDELKVICQYGDPNDLKIEQNDADKFSYTYWDSGKIFYFDHGKMVKEQNIPRQPGMTFKN